MARKKVADEAIQLPLDLLLEQLEQEPDKPHKLPITADDIGGELLAILSKGLYTNPLDAIREYVQNCVDARAQNITIKITGNSVIVHDDGNGMDLDDLLHARQFGLSPKLYAEHVGFRGIGIYSGYDLCRRLRITSTKAGDPHVHVLVFEFAAMKAQLDSERGREVASKKTSLPKLLSEHTYIQRQSTAFEPDLHFTQLELQDISDVHIRQLSNRTDLRSYLLQNLPIDFADSFPYKAEINHQLAARVPGYHPVSIQVQSDGQPDETISKYAGLNPLRPRFGYVLNSAGQQVAYYWACLNRERGLLHVTYPEEGSKYEGFVYKCKGFSIGDRNKLRSTFVRKSQLYGWHTGEVYVIDPAVIPNAERDDFETSQAKRSLELALLDEFDRRLLPDAERFQSEGVAHDRIEKYTTKIAAIESNVLGSLASDADAYAPDAAIFSDLVRILDDMKRQKKEASPEDKPRAEEIIQKAERLQKRLWKQADAPADETPKKRSERRKKGAIERPDPQLPIPTLVPETRTLMGILDEAGWQIDGQCDRLVQIIQESLEEVLSSTSTPYRNLLALIESRLNSAGADE